MKDKSTNEYYEDYCRILKEDTKGLVEPTMADFFKMVAFYMAIDYPIQQKNMDILESMVRGKNREKRL